MRLKTASGHKEATYWEMERQEEKTYVDSLHGAARNVATGAELCVIIFNGLLS